MDEVPLRAGQTLFVPSGWIHAVHTPSEDTLVFGGNFLQRHSFEMQLRIHRLEGYMKVGPEYRFPNYQKLMWYATRDFLGECAEILRKEDGGRRRTGTSKRRRISNKTWSNATIRRERCIPGDYGGA